MFTVHTRSFRIVLILMMKTNSLFIKYRNSSHNVCMDRIILKEALAQDEKRWEQICDDVEPMPYRRLGVPKH